MLPKGVAGLANSEGKDQTAPSGTVKEQSDLDLFPGPGRQKTLDHYGSLNGLIRCSYTEHD